MINSIKFSKLNNTAKSPFRKNPTDAGMDFYSCETVEIEPHNFKIVHTGISVEIPEGYALILKPKGKNNHLVGAGVIDAYYHPGEILVKVVNFSDNILVIREHDSIAQGIYIPVATPTLVEVPVDELKNNSTRSGAGGIVTQSKNQ